MPCGPDSPLCPVNASASICISSICMGHVLAVWGFKSFGRDSGKSCPSCAQGILVNETPWRDSCTSGRMTALCSMEDTSTWPQGFKNPLSRIFRLSVAFLVNTTFLQLSPPNIRHSCCLALKERYQNFSINGRTNQINNCLFIKKDFACIRHLALFGETKLLAGFLAIGISAFACNLVLNGITDGPTANGRAAVLAGLAVAAAIACLNTFYKKKQ